ncbi:hypothetical protein EG352_10055 [Chryseobacterium indologenes]|uniref:C1q domain-containing protein n=2 Tax=Chryseobacterium indologenes TaxID=253 RepID=A0AAD0YVZ1_CHRID|nr:hypothetical protein EG352_10055 [Chryseobacterium indologenes]
MVLMKTRLFCLSFLLFVSQLYLGQFVIGSTNVSPGAIVKLDANNKALRIPNLAITARNSTTTPITAPALGVLLYNTSMDINNDLTPSLAYWGSDNQYHSQATSTATESIISSANIPLLIFSANIGQKPYTVLGTASGGSATPLTLTSQEILVDKYSGWNLGTSQYTVPSTGIYLVEFVSVMSNTANSGGTSTNRLLDNGSFIGFVSGRFVLNRMYTTLINTRNLTVNHLLSFQYSYTAGNYRMESGTINIYKY